MNIRKIAHRIRETAPGLYEVGETGYRVERMVDGFWDAYLPDADGHRAWYSTYHHSRRAAIMAVAAERRRIAEAVVEAKQ